MLALALAQMLHMLSMMMVCKQWKLGAKARMASTWLLRILQCGQEGRRGEVCQHGRPHLADRRQMVGLRVRRRMGSSSGRMRLATAGLHPLLKQGNGSLLGPTCSQQAEGRSGGRRCHAVRAAAGSCCRDASVVDVQHGVADLVQDGVAAVPLLRDVRPRSAWVVAFCAAC
mmetsp:Transcript_51972/g.147287  ORF Transcript_51972/g.147287 Transcript_51972/m.147287 type:complete len:171 (+) Transcript_51972:45-557(+)